MGQVIFVAFFAAAAAGLALLGYATGYSDAIERMEDEYEAEEEEKKRKTDLTDRVRRYARKHKCIDYRIW